MGGSRLLARAIRRRNRRQTIFLILFAGLAGGAVLTSVGVARRTSSAIDRYLARPEVADSIVLVCPEGATEEDVGDDLAGVCGRQADLIDPLAALRTAPGVERASRYALVVSGVRTSDEEAWRPVIHQALVDPWPGLPDAPIVVDGRLPGRDASTEVAVNEALARELGVRAGDRIQVGRYASAQLQRISVGQQDRPELGAVAATVVGVVRSVSDLQVDPEPTLLTGAGWWADHGSDDLAGYGTGVIVALDGASTARRFERSLETLLPNRLAMANPTIEAEPSKRTVGLQASASEAVALALVLAALGFVSQAVGRSVRRDLSDRPSLAAMGMTRSDLMWVVLFRMAPVAVGASLVALVVGVAASPIGPVGMARTIEVDPGVHLDRPVAVLGGILVGVTIVVLAWAAVALALWRTPRRTSRALVTAPPWAPIGVRSGVGLLRRQDPAAVSGAILGTALAIAAGMFALGVRSSEAQLISSPARYGQTWDLTVGNFASAEEYEAGAAAMDDVPGVDDFDAARETTTRLERPGRSLDGVTLVAFTRPGGEVDPTVVRGRAPTRSGEIGLGSRTIRQLGVDLGDQITVRAPASNRRVGPFTVVGEVLVNDGVDSIHRVDEGALVTSTAFDRIDKPTVGQSLLVKAAPGASRGQLEAALRARFGQFVESPTPPDDLSNLGRVSNAPVLLAVLIGLLAAGALVHAVLTVIARRQRDIAILRTLGFTRTQVVLAHQTVSLVIVGAALVVGIPLGIVAIRRGWSQIQGIVGTASPEVLPWAGLAVIAAGTVFLALLVTTVPALWVARRRPAEALRSE